MSPMTIVRRASARLVLQCCAVVVSALYTREVHAQAIRPVFAWPAGASATMVTEVTSVEGFPAGAAVAVPRKTTVSFRITAHPEGLQITSQTIAIDPPIPPTSTPGLDMESLTRRISTFVVQKTGAFIRLEDTLALKQFGDSLAFNVAASLTNSTRGVSSPATDAVIVRMQEQMRATLSVKNLTQTSKRAWESQSVAFAGRSWKPGDSATYSFETVEPNASNAMLPSLQMVRFDGEVPCPAGTVTRCWKFSTRASSSRERTRAAMRAQMRSTMNSIVASAGGAGSDAFERAMAMADTMPVPMTSTTSETIVDAATLLPLRITSTMRNETGRSGAPPMVSRTVTTYTWKR